MDKKSEQFAILTTAALSVLIAGADFLGLLDSIQWLSARIPTLQLLLLGIIAGYLALERKSVFERLEKEIKKNQAESAGAFGAIHRAIEAGVPFQILSNEKSIFEEAARLVSICKDSGVIRATGLTPAIASDETPATDSSEYLLAVARRIKQAKMQGGSLSYRVVLGDETTQEREKTIQKRQHTFSTEGVSDRLAIRVLDTTWPLEMLLIDKSMILGFASLTGDWTFRVGIKITDMSLVGQISEWYDDFLWSTGKVVK